MCRLIRSDLYRLFRRPYLFVLTGFLSVLAILFNLMFSVDTSVQRSFQFSLNYLKFLPLFEVMIVDIVMAEENKFSTLKNTVSAGFGRRHVYTGKLITSIILTLFCDGITFLFYLCSAFFRLYARNDMTSAFMADYTLKIAVALLLILSAMFVAMVFAVAFQKNAVYIFSFIGFILILPLVFEGFGIQMDAFRVLYEITIFGQAESLYNIKTAQLYIPVLVAILHIAIFSIFGIRLFRRQEIS
jgi:ABC-2 type transport system permease protein